MAEAAGAVDAKKASERAAADRKAAEHASAEAERAVTAQQARRTRCLSFSFHNFTRLCSEWCPRFSGPPA